jgi:hypothetical protein
MRSNSLKPIPSRIASNSIKGIFEGIRSNKNAYIAAKNSIRGDIASDGIQLIENIGKTIPSTPSPYRGDIPVREFPPFMARTAGIFRRITFFLRDSLILSALWAASVSIEAVQKNDIPLVYQ